MTQSNFYSKLKEKLEDYFNCNAEASASIYCNNSVWTEVITKNSRNAMPLIDEVLCEMYENCKLLNEYYRIDNGVYEDVEDGYIRNFKNTGINVHKWKLIAAVEHENNWKEWTDEFVKLAYIQAGLRVVISYGDYETKYKEAIEVANELANMIFLDEFVKADTDEFILIFGPRKESVKEHKDLKISDMFLGYKWNGEEFILIGEE